MITKDEIKAAVAGVSVKGDVFTYAFHEGHTLTAQQVADIEASKIVSKWATRLAEYLNLCADLRAADPAMTDVVVQTMARASFQTGA